MTSVFRAAALRAAIDVGAAGEGEEDKGRKNEAHFYRRVVGRFKSG